MSPTTDKPETIESVDLFTPFTKSELVIGLVGAVGTELKKVSDIIEARLTTARYSVVHVHISKKVIPEIVPIGDFRADQEYERITALMDAGNRARESTKDNSILALGAAAYISLKREKEKDQPVLRPRARTAYIIHSLKHPEEVSRFRGIYTHGFFLVGVHSGPERRLKYLRENKRISLENAQRLMTRDEHEKEGHGQKLRETFHLSDYFVRSNGNEDELQNSLWRCLDILFGHPNKTPTFDEYAMFMAFVSSLRSADLSRQVGAVVSKDDEILSTGANDCPRFGGGLYWPQHNPGTHSIEDADGGRDYKRGADSNRVEVLSILKDLLDRGHANGLDKAALEKTIMGTRIEDLTEFGRVVHAEMEAILCCARNHVSTRAATLYCTTFPCHNCAKHIIAAGIHRVVFIEPYPKSKAADNHPDAIHPDSQPEDTVSKVAFTSFEGVGPRRFFDLFSIKLGAGQVVKRKHDNGKAMEWDIATASLRHQMVPCSYLDLEMLATTRFAELTQKENP